MGSRLRLVSCLAAAVGALLAGCSESTSTAKAQSRPAAALSGAATTAPTTAPPTTAPGVSTTTLPPFTTSIATTSTTSTTSVVTTSTLAPTTVAAPIESLPTRTLPARILPTEDTLPTPAAAPVDPNAAEAGLQIGTIEIPSINVTKPMFEGVTLTTLNRGPGHWPGTALPGEIGNVVVGGHRVSHDRPFRNIDRLDVGDDVFLTTAAGRFDYKVVGSEVVTPDAIRIIDQTSDRTATLFACTPPGSTGHRLVIHLALSQ